MMALRGPTGLLRDVRRWMDLVRRFVGLRVTQSELPRATILVAERLSAKTRSLTDATFRTCVIQARQRLPL